MTNVATALGSDAACCTPKAKGGFAKFLGGLVVGLLVGLALGAVGPDWLKYMNAQPNKTTLPSAKHAAPANEPPVVPSPIIDPNKPVTPVDPAKPVTTPH